MGQASLYDLVCHDLGTSAGLSQLRPQTINEPRVVGPLLAQCKCWITTPVGICTMLSDSVDSRFHRVRIQPTPLGSSTNLFRPVNSHGTKFPTFLYNVWTRVCHLRISRSCITRAGFLFWSFLTPSRSCATRTGQEVSRALFASCPVFVLLRSVGVATCLLQLVHD